MLDKNWIRNLFRSIGYPIGPTSKLYKGKQETIKRVFLDIITTQAWSLDVLLTALHELHPRKTFEMVDKRSNIQLADLNSNPHGGKILRDLIDHAIGSRFYPNTGSKQYKLLWLDQFHGHWIMKISNALKKYYKHPRQSYVKDRAFSISFICMDMSNQII